MNRSVPVLAACLLLLPFAALSQPYGLSNRVANTSLRMPGSLPVFGYTSNNAFGTMTFTAPVAIVSAPGETNRLFIVEQPGRIVVITNLANPTRTVFMDISSRVLYGGEQGLLGLAFHPGYLTNRYFFIFYTLTSGTRNDRLSRFEISPTNSNAGVATSEVVLFSQPDDFVNHNAGDLHFALDGYLYVSLGDEGDANDTGANSQRIDKDFFSGIMRLDVDQLPGNLVPTPHAALLGATNYFVPADNPFVGATQFNGLPINTNALRTEFWAVGLRNPWRFSFDYTTGLLYCGDVGQNTREEVDIITKGGNYGWNYREGYIQRPGSGAPPAGFTSIQPILDYPRSPAGATNVGYSVTGGVVYRGNRIPQLNGAYIFGDYGSGNIWMLRYDGSIKTNVPYFRLMVDPGVSAFGIDPSNGDLLYADVDDGRVKRLLYAPISGGPLPPTLAETGAFTDLATLQPYPGIVPYDVTVPSWSDGAQKTRWFSIPDVTRTIVYRTPVPPAYNPWSFPTGMVWIQHFDLELTNGLPDSRRRIETRFLVRDIAAGIYGLTYRWQDSQTNAALVAPEGMDESFVINDGGNLRTQAWHYPSRSECLTCHVSPAFVGGFNVAQLNRDFDYHGIVDNQLRSLSYAGYFNNPITNLHSLPLVAEPRDPSFSLEYRARSYLMANCAQCHLGSANAQGFFDARIYRPFSTAGLVNGPLTNYMGNPANRVLVPDSLSNSMLLTRISTRGPGQMPPIDSSLLDTQAINLISRWITNDLPNFESFSSWQMRYFGSTNSPEALAAADADLDGALNYLEYLTATSPTNALEFWPPAGIQLSSNNVEIIYSRIANRGFEVQCTTNYPNSNSWLALNVPENRPFSSASNSVARVPDLVTNLPAGKFYRVRAYEP